VNNLGSYGFGAPAPSPKPARKYTESDLFAMTKTEQIRILKSLGVTKIPKKESSRVKKILELV